MKAHRGQYGFDEKIVIKENEQGEKKHIRSLAMPVSFMMLCRMQLT